MGGAGRCQHLLWASWLLGWWEALANSTPLCLYLTSLQVMEQRISTELPIRALICACWESLAHFDLVNVHVHHRFCEQRVIQHAPGLPGQLELCLIRLPSAQSAFQVCESGAS